VPLPLPLQLLETTPSLSWMQQPEQEVHPDEAETLPWSLSPPRLLPTTHVAILDQAVALAGTAQAGALAESAEAAADRGPGATSRDVGVQASGVTSQDVGAQAVWVLEGSLAGSSARYHLALELVSGADFWSRGSPGDLGGLWIDFLLKAKENTPN